MMLILKDFRYTASDFYYMKIFPFPIFEMLGLWKLMQM